MYFAFQRSKIGNFLPKWKQVERLAFCFKNQSLFVLLDTSPLLCYTLINKFDSSAMLWQCRQLKKKLLSIAEKLVVVSLPL